MSTSAAPAVAQGLTGDLFGGTRSEGGGRERLNVSVFVGETLASEVPPEFRRFAAGNEQLFGRSSTLFAASADYARNRRRVQLFGAGSTFVRYRPDFDRTAAVSHHAALGAGVRLPNQGSLKITQTAAYAPSYLYLLFPTAAAPLTPEEAIPVTAAAYRTDSYAYRTTMALAFGSRFGTRVTTTADYGVNDVQRRTAAHHTLTTYATGAKVSRALSRSGGLSAEYEYRVGDFASSGLTKTHRVTVGAEYAAALSPTRRATFRVEMSPSVTAVQPVPGSAEQRRSHLQGEAAVEYPFRLKWRAEASYRRAVQYLADLSEPVFTNGARVKLTGAIGRVNIRALAGRASAASAVSRSNRNLSTYTGEARLGYAVTRALAVFSEYLYYYYDLAEQARLAPNLPSVYEQHEIRVGFTLVGRVFGR